MSGGFNENVLGFDVSVANTQSVDVGDGSHHLIGVEFDQKRRHHLFHLQVLLHDPVDRIRYEVHDYIQVDLVGLVTISVERLSHLDAVRVM